MSETQTPPELSRSRVNRAGEALIAAHVAGEELPSSECEIVTEWRQRHAAPLVWINMTLQKRLETSPLTG